MKMWRNESQLLNAIIRVLYPYCTLHRVNVGRVRTPDGRYFTTGVPVGYPDLSGYRRSDGRAVYIECKVKPNKPTPKQLEFISEAQEAGCLAAVCYSPDEALRLVLPRFEEPFDENF